MRVGLGYDAHALVEGRDLFLGGVLIPYPRGLLGHSDGDVLLHALADAVLGAAGCEDIGGLFPSTDAEIKGIASERILSKAMELARSKGYKVVNVDVVVVCEAPRINVYKDEIRTNISRIMKVEASRVSLKGKTTEGMGFTGRGEGIESYAVCLLE